MSQDSVYTKYVEGDFMPAYLAYQRQYASQMRESDRVLLSLLADVVAGREEQAVVVDIGCSTGNLLRHVKGAFPDLSLVGAELSVESLDVCRADPELSGVDFREMDIVRMTEEGSFDVAMVNAVLYMLTDEEFAAALDGISRSLRPGGALIAFDFFHGFPQDLAIRERSASHPDGLMLHFRPMATVEQALHGAGFTSVSFNPFEIPIDLERGRRFGEDAGFEELNSYTVPAADGRRLLFRGTLFQPWCHLVARMPEAA